MEQFLLIIFQILVVLFSVVVHEVSHGVVANGLGDPTAKNLGRLTLNPIKHLDFFGSILLPLFTFFAGGFIFGYAKPVPYNPYNLRDAKYGPTKVAVAGPLSNIIIAVFFGLALRFLPDPLYLTLIPKLFSFIVLLNLVLAVFNLMPIPPLDGHWLFLTFVPDSFNQLKKFVLRYGLVLFFFFIIFIFPFLFPIIRFLFKLIAGSDPVIF